MKKINKIKSAITISLSLLVVGCGGSGGESEYLSSANSFSSTSKQTPKAPVWKIFESVDDEKSVPENSYSAKSTATPSTSSEKSSQSDAYTDIDGAIVQVRELSAASITRLKAMLDAGQLVTLVSDGSLESRTLLGDIAYKISEVRVTLPGVTLYTGGTFSGSDGVSLFPLESLDLDKLLKEVEVFARNVEVATNN